MTLRTSLIFLLFISATLYAQENRTSADQPDGFSLEDRIQNPISNLASIPIEYNLSSHSEPANTLSFQPVIPVALSKKWLLVNRAIVPFVNQPTATGYQNGIGNTILTATLTAAEPSDFTWGAGPAFMLPAKNNYLGSDKFSVGPSVVALKQYNGFTYGLMIQNFFSVAGPSDTEDVNYLNSQLILSKNLNNGWYVYSNPSISVDWNASDKQWTVPLGAGMGKLITHNRYLPIHVKAGVYKYVAHPTDANWLVQAQATFILKYKKYR